MGPTASGKTEIAISLSKRFPCDIISVDSALVYRGMDIGTAKPDQKTLQRVPHQLVDIRDPEESYSAGEFVRDAKAAMQQSFDAGRTPLLAGGTMMYFRALTQGMAELPAADTEVRRQIDAEAAEQGWPALHRQLAEIDPESATRLNPNDSQRIQRAIEVFRLSGKSLSDWHRQDIHGGDDIEYAKIGLRIEPRSLLHERIALRLQNMLDAGFEDEMRHLKLRPGLSADSPAMRSVGYRQFWRYIEGEDDLQQAHDKTLFATRQLAKRQLTWLRSENDVFFVDALEAEAIGTISSYLVEFLNA
ncbi:MAG: tRNA (adenosine(37)-N6)-dimethylallyltransferase MiaA [Gammaproteobacteria bacterium]|nr:tRNA (adenosine(37)-N6)-dimethylallyltransferase MiaA [Gammaproteobacteria bacterium]